MAVTLAYGESNLPDTTLYPKYNSLGDITGRRKGMPVGPILDPLAFLRKLCEVGTHAAQALSVATTQVTTPFAKEELDLPELHNIDRYGARWRDTVTQCRGGLRSLMHLPRTLWGAVSAARQHASEILSVPTEDTSSAISFFHQPRVKRLLTYFAPIAGFCVNVAYIQGTMETNHPHRPTVNPDMQVAAILQTHQSVAVQAPKTDQVVPFSLTGEKTFSVPHLFRAVQAYAHGQGHKEMAYRYPSGYSRAAVDAFYAKFPQVHAAMRRHGSGRFQITMAASPANGQLAVTRIVAHDGTVLLAKSVTLAPVLR